MADFIRNVGTQEFEQCVVERSSQVPVVVDFWAGWCTPCRILAPLLEREVQALGGRVELVKVDVEAHPELAGRFSIRGIPAVKVFRGGRVVAEFEGSRDALFLRSWLSQVAPSPARQAIEQAELALQRGEWEWAERELRRLLEEPEVSSRAAVRLAGAMLELEREEEVGELLARVDPRSEDARWVPVLQRQLQFIKDAAAYGGEEKARANLATRPDDLEARYALASALAAQANWAGALEELLAIVNRDREFRDDGARLAMLALFERLGPSSELVREYRRRLQVVL